jgi:hypothetical protein
MDDETKKGVFLLALIGLVLLGAYFAAQAFQGGEYFTITRLFSHGL